MIPADNSTIHFGIDTTWSNGFGFFRDASGGLLFIGLVIAVAAIAVCAVIVVWGKVRPASWAARVTTGTLVGVASGAVVLGSITGGVAWASTLATPPGLVVPEPAKVDLGDPNAWKAKLKPLPTVQPATGCKNYNSRSGLCLDDPGAKKSAKPKPPTEMPPAPEKTSPSTCHARDIRTGACRD